MKNGLRIGLVSDAGTPTISDPGFAFIKEAQESGIAVEPLPGPCAAVTALSASGFPSERFQFKGYLSKTLSDREETLLQINQSGLTTVLYESPNRLMRTLDSIRNICGEDQEVFVALEMTKMHEAHYRGTVNQVFDDINEIHSEKRIKGEVSLVIGPPVEGEH
jgi:16S rRNA (cytidine1402-2'-O)-methyltransferase